MSSLPVILVTGASSGIGAACARLFAQEGYRVVLAARRFDRLEQLAGEIGAAGGQALPIAADLCQLEDIQRLVSRALDEFGQIDVLLNNAGFGRLGWLEELDPASDVEAQLRVNLAAVIQLSRQVLAPMMRRRSGHIINMASMAGLIATPTYSVYAASKFAVRGFSEALRREVGVWGIHVSVIYPGGVETEFGEHTGARRKSGTTTPDWLRLSAEQVARAVLSVARRPRRCLILPWPMKFAVWANALFPGALDWLMERQFTQPERGLS